MKGARLVVEGLMRHSLRRAFRRVCWVGPPPALPPATPVVLFANHHNFFDAYLGWLLAHRLLGRPVITWMEDWDRFPFFAAVGALPFPADDPARRAATLRRTARRLREAPDTVLVYFPEGRLHPPEDGLLPFDPVTIRRLDRLLGRPCWWPVGVHVTWWGEATPTALLSGGTPTPGASGEECARLEATWQVLRTSVPSSTTTLLDGRRSPQERWNFALLHRLFAPSS